MIFPDGIKRKVKSFKFTSYVAEKKEFMEVVEVGWKDNIVGCHMFKVVKKMKNLKRSLNQLR
jgi:hypothetical protein